MPILRYIHVTKEFAPNAYGVKDVSFEVDPGELVVITGHTGSGKTTLMKLLTREYSVSEGELYFNEIPVHQLKSNKVHLHRRQIGVVYQDYRLIKDLTVWENVALPLYIAGKKEAEIEQRTSDLLNLIKLADKYDSFPNQLSGGEAQRVSIARSLALAPELIFADEPTGNLDLDTSRTIALLLAKINELGTTVLLSTHDLTLLDVFTTERHVQLENGSIVKDSGSQKTKTKPEPAKPIKLDIVDPVASDQDKVIVKSTDASLAPEKKPFWHRLGLNKTKQKASELKEKEPAVVPPVEVPTTTEHETTKSAKKHNHSSQHHKKE